MIVAFVVAIAENGAIGRSGQLPWRMPTDLKRFRQLTLGKPVIMGRKTYDSIGRPLDGRDNIVVTRRKELCSAAVHVADSLARALELGRKFAAHRGTDEVLVIGGAEIFRNALPLTQRVYLTLVHGRPDGDIFLAPFDPKVWRESHREPMQRSDGDQFSADFIVLDRQS